jgi:hypothetical protein
MSLVADMIARGWENFLARPAGPLNLRFILQPAIASIIALRAGIRDAREGRPPYLWSAFVDPAYRSQFLHAGWKDIRMPFLMSIGLDIVYQIYIHQFIYPLELLFTATLLALVPYFVLRGPVNRIARRFMVRSRDVDQAHKDVGS